MRYPWHKVVWDASTWVSVLRNAIWLVPAVVSGVAYLYARPGYRSFLLIGLPAAVASAAITYAICTWILRRGSHLGYRINSARYTYVFDEHDVSRHRQEVVTEITAERDGVTLYASRFSWSGSGSNEISLVDAPGQILLRHPGMQYEGHSYYYVNFIPPLFKGDEKRVEVRHDLVDAGRRMDFQLTKRISRPIDFLTLTVVFPPGGPAKNDVWALARRSARDDSRPIEKLPIEYDASGCRATLTVKRPKLGVTYAVEWHWAAYRTGSMVPDARPAESGKDDSDV